MGLDLILFSLITKVNVLNFFLVPPAVLSRSRINAEKRQMETIREEEEAMKNEARNWARVYPYNRVARAAIRKKDGVKVYYIH